MFLNAVDATNPNNADLADAVTVGDEVISHAALYQAATAFAATLPDAGPVAVCATPSMETIIAVTGCLLAGVPVVPVPPDSGAAERRHMITDSRATCWAGHAPEDAAALPVLPVRRRPAATSTAPSAARMDDVAMILYTSGTTGPPKGVELSHRALAAGIDALAHAWDWHPDDTVVHGLPLFHMHGLVLGVLASLRIGSRVAHTVRPRPTHYAATPGSMYFAVPTVWSRIAADPSSARALRPARLLVSGSAPLPTTVFDSLTGLTGRAPLERYGMSETMITLSTRADGERRPGWVGEPLRGVQTRLRADNGDTVPHDGHSIGRLEVRGPMLFDAYLNRPDATAAAWTSDGWFSTGDVAVCDPNGYHRIVGRESVDLIKSGGYRVGAGEIEAALLAHPAVREAAVVGHHDADLGQRIVAYIVPDDAHQPAQHLADRLIDHVATSLSRHKRPRAVVFLDALPRNAMGKVQKSLLCT
ncbi:acyl-CoA synthetase [Streptomyces sp. NPDC102437]|uniref:acyl-CoA synthetase n=1 Tax=Streptomyces sp. NPDC102437 TaxID=3366175 RepID=UPI003814E1A3